MPIYTFNCETCGTTFDSVERYSDMVLMRHPECPKGCGVSGVKRNAGEAVGSYQIRGDNSASTRPKGGGSFNKSKK